MKYTPQAIAFKSTKIAIGDSPPPPDLISVAVALAPFFLGFRGSIYQKVEERDVLETIVKKRNLLS